MSWMWWVARRLVVYLISVYLKFSIIIIIIMSLLSLSVQFCFFKSTQWRLVATPLTPQQPRYHHSKSDFILYPESNLCNPQILPGLLCGLTWWCVVWWRAIWKWPIFTLKVGLGGVWYIYEAEPEPTGNSAILSKRKWQLRWFTTVENSRGPTLIGSTA